MLNEYNQKIVDVSGSGDTVGLEYLLTRSPSVSAQIDALWMAALSGKDGCVRLLIDALYPLLDQDKDFVYQALLYAADGGNSQCINLLLPFSSIVHNTMALKQAAKHGYVECVTTLIPVSEPRFNSSEALRHAAKRGHNGCVDALYCVSQPFEALEQLRGRHPDKRYKWEYLEQLCQRDILLRAVNDLDPCNEERRKI